MIAWSNYKKGINLVSWLVLWTCSICLMRYIGFLLSKMLPQHQNTLMFKYGNFDIVFLHQIITGLAETGILFPNNLNALKLLIIMLISMFDTWHIWHIYTCIYIHIYICIFIMLYILYIYINYTWNTRN